MPNVLAPNFAIPNIVHPPPPRPGYEIVSRLAPPPTLASHVLLQDCCRPCAEAGHRHFFRAPCPRIRDEMSRWTRAISPCLVVTFLLFICYRHQTNSVLPRQLKDSVRYESPSRPHNGAAVQQELPVPVPMQPNQTRRAAAPLPEPVTAPGLSHGSASEALSDRVGPASRMSQASPADEPAPHRGVETGALHVSPPFKSGVGGANGAIRVLHGKGMVTGHALSPSSSSMSS